MHRLTTEGWYGDRAFAPGTPIHWLPLPSPPTEPARTLLRLGYAPCRLGDSPHLCYLVPRVDTYEDSSGDEH